MEEDTGEGMQCSEHPLRTNPHGICPLCLQDKLGKLLSLPLPIRPSSSSSTPPSPPSLPSLPPPSSLNNNNHRRHRLPFLSTRKNNKHTTKPKPSLTPPPSSSSSAVFKRSKSTVTPRRAKLLDDHPADNNSPIPISRKRNRFWSFLHVSSKNNNHNHHHTTTPSMKLKEKCEAASSSSSSLSLVSRKISIVVEDNEEEACTHATNNSNNNNSSSRQASSSTCSSLERKVSRSRSVGCGSRSFSGDFFERISTGFGDCALRRVESHREGKPSKSNHRARCGGLFSGFIIHSSSSSSSSSSYLVEESRHHHHQTTARKSSESRGKYWAWPLFASPMRVFTTAKPSHAKDVVHKNNATSPNLSAIPSLLAVRG